MRAKAYRIAVLLLVFGAWVPGRASEAEPPPGWALEAQQRIEAAEYEVSWRDGYQAPNRAQGFRTFFVDQGIRAVPRVETESTWEWELHWTGYGRGNDSGALPEAELSPSKNRIEYRRGPFLEWYENRPDGLKQGFVLPGPPEELAGASHSDAPVHLDLALTGSLLPVISEDGHAIDFVTVEAVRVLRYAELRVHDARGTELRSWMEGFARDGVRGIRLLFDGRDAVYPVTIDPLTFSPVWTNESNQATAEFGKSVGTAGDVNGDGYSDVIIGAPLYDNGQADEGRAYVYHGSALGLPATPAWFVESDQDGARFGWSVATAGDVNGDGYSDVIVGAQLYDNGHIDEGRAYVYLGSATGLSTTVAWTKEIDQTSAQFGTSVACAGDVNGDGFADVIVGAYLYDNGQTDEGRAFVYLGSASGLAATPIWTAEGDQASAQFGWSVATAGDVNGDGFADVLVGSPRYDNFHTDEGRAYLYFGSSSGVSPTFNWFQEPNQANAQFGYSVATAGDIDGSGYADIIVGAWQYSNGQSFEGRAFLYLGFASGLASFPISTIENNQPDSYLGWSVGTAGDINGDGFADVIVTAPFYSIDATSGGGEAQVYLGSQSGLAPLPVWTHLRSLANAAYGWSAATAGDVNGDGYADIVVGAPWDDNGQTNEGLAYVHHGSPSVLGSTPAWTESHQVSAEAGLAVSTAGDVNGDGYADLIVGAPYYDNGEADEGKVFLLVGSASGLIATLWNAEGNQAGAHFGAALGTAGDVNGDGYDDVIVGAPLYDTSQTDDGRAFVYLGSAGLPTTTAVWSSWGGISSSRYGAAVGTAGDVNGDGYADVIIGSPGVSGAPQRARVHLGSTSGLGPGFAWTGSIAQADSGYGSAVATAGDVNGDGYSDVIVGAARYANGQSSEGGAFVYLGSAGGPATAAAWIGESDQSNALLGSAVGTAGDVNGDGYADVIVGAHNYDNGQSDEGRALVYLGSAGGLATSAAWTMETDQSMARVGSVATAGDVNGDGYADVIVGSFHFSADLFVEGKAWVFFGSAAGLQTTPAWTAEGNQEDSWFGAAVSTAGDVNGDGYADVVIGAPFFDNGQNDEGRASIYFGNGKGIALNPRQRTSGDTRAVARLGLSDNGNAFRLAALGRTPFGRGKVKLEWEVKPFGTLLNGTGTGVGAASVDTGISGGQLDELVTSLVPATRYHWRVRLVYDQASVPFAKRGRWVTMPWGGWNEAMLRTAAPTPVAAGRSDAITIAKVGFGITLSWTGNASCNAADTDHAIYEGTLGNFASHVPVTCTTSPAHSWNFTPGSGNRYLLLVPINAAREGSYGLGVGGAERAASAAACKPQLVACP